MKHAVSWITVVAFALAISSAMRAQSRITLLSPDPLKPEVDRIVRNFEMKTGDTVQQSYGTGVGTRKRVQEGGALDVTLLFAPFDDALKTGNVDKSTQTVVASVRLALAVKKGSPSPDISSAAAVRKLLLDARSVATVDPAQGQRGRSRPSGAGQNGYHGPDQAQTQVFFGGGGVQDAVANGEIEIALGPYLSDMRNPGLNIVELCPRTPLLPSTSPPGSPPMWEIARRPSRSSIISNPRKSPRSGRRKVFPVTN